MQVVDQFGHARIHIDEALREFIGVAGGVADAFDAWDLGHIVDQRGEVGDLGAAAHRAPVGIDILSEQRDLAHALAGQLCHLDQHIVERP